MVEKVSGTGFSGLTQETLSGAGEASSSGSCSAPKRQRLESPSGLAPRPISRGKRLELPRPRAANVFIANRDDARGGGRQWDHVSLQELGGRPTVGVASAKQAALEHDVDWFPPKDFPRYAIATPEMKIDGKAGEGLLVVPGGPNSLPTEMPEMRFAPKKTREASASARVENQEELLRSARNTGQPVLAICGGSWHAAAAFGGNTQTDKLFEAQHLADMPSFVPLEQGETQQAPSLAVDHAKLNQHEITVVPESMLGHLMRDTGPLAPANVTGEIHASVNSVHWAHVIATVEAGSLEIAGTDVSGRQPSRVTGQIQAPPIDTPTRDLLVVTAAAKDAAGHQTVEAFETRHGAPLIAVQYHPEALAGRPARETETYTAERYATERGQAERLVSAMIQAGDAFAARREMTRDFQQQVEAPSSLGDTAALESARKNKNL